MRLLSVSGAKLRFAAWGGLFGFGAFGSSSGPGFAAKIRCQG